MSCSGAFATPVDLATMFVCGDLTSEEQTSWQAALDLTAGNIHAVLAQTAACDCTLASWATNYLAKLNVLEAALLRQCGCGMSPLTDEDKGLYKAILDTEYERILTGQIDVCQDATGINYPAADFIQQALTPWSAGQIVINRIKKTSW